MPRRLVLPDHLPRAELERRYRSAHDPVARSHWQILWLLVRGDRTADVADVTGYSTTWVREVAKRYREGGPDALGDRRHGNPGRSDRALLTPALRDALRQSLGVRRPMGESGRVPRWPSG